jgi:hypothetical protein
MRNEDDLSAPPDSQSAWSTAEDKARFIRKAKRRERYLDERARKNLENIRQRALQWRAGRRTAE